MADLSTINRMICILVASDSDTVADEVRDLVLHESRNCSEVHTFPLSEAGDRAAQYRPEVVIFILPKEPGRALQTMGEIQETCPTRILVIGPAAEAKLILRTLRAGAYQYIDREEIGHELPTVLRRLRSESPLRVQHGRIISVLGVSGGTGASMLASNISVELARSHQSCVLIDLKLETGDLPTLLDLQPAHSLGDFCQNVERMDQSMFERCLERHPSGIHLLASPWSYNEASRITPRGIRKALTMCRNTFPYVVVDLDNSYRKEHAEAIFQSDMILLVLRLDFVALRQARRTLDYLQELRIDPERVRILINRFGRPKELRVADVEKSLGMKVFRLIPDDPNSVNRAINRGVPVVLDKPRAAISQCLIGIAQSVNGKH